MREFLTRRGAALLLLLLASVSTTSAQQTPAQRRTSLNIHGELMQCSPYFELLAACMRTRPDAPGAETRARDLQSRAVDFKELAIRIGLGIGLTQDAITSRYRFNMEEMIRLTAGQPCENLASLMSRWQAMCVEYSTDPERAMRRHLQ